MIDINLSLNFNQIIAILFGNHIKKNRKKMIEIDGLQIDNVSEITFLSVTIENN